MLVDNTFAISVPQLVNVFPFFPSRQNEASKTLKRLMGKGFRPGKTATESTNALVNVLTLDQFVSVIVRYYRSSFTGRTRRAININSTEYLYLTYPTAEAILNYEANNLRKKIASKSLKAFLGKALIPGKFTGIIVNKQSGGFFVYFGIVE